MEGNFRCEYILTFNLPEIPKVKIRYSLERVEQYISALLKYLKCQRFGQPREDYRGCQSCGRCDKRSRSYWGRLPKWKEMPKLSTKPPHFLKILWQKREGMSRVFTNDLGDRGSIPGQVIPKTQKMVLNAALLNTQHYKVQVKGKVEQSRERSNASFSKKKKKGSLFNSYYLGVVAVQINKWTQTCLRSCLLTIHLKIKYVSTRFGIKLTI